MNVKCPSCQNEFTISTNVSKVFCPLCGIEISTSSSALDNNDNSNSNDSNNNICPVCSTNIENNDDVVVCKDCKIKYHNECWNDNNGCATYGCQQSGSLNPPPLKVTLDDLNNAHTNSYQNYNSKNYNNYTNSNSNNCDENIGEYELASPWRRYTARLLDYTIISVILYCIWGVIISSYWNVGDSQESLLLLSNMNNIASIFISFISYFIEVVIYMLFGNTLGKFLCGIKIIEKDGSVISPQHYLTRAGHLFVSGYGAGFLTFITFPYQYFRVAKGLPASYDEKLELKCVKVKQNDLVRILGSIITMVVTVITILGFAFLIAFILLTITKFMGLTF